MSYEKLKKKAKTFKTFTGLSIEQFNTLYGEIKKQYSKYEHKRLNRKNRKRAIGAGRKFKRSLQDRILMALMYYRLYVTNELLGYLFDLDQSTISRDVKKIEPVIKACIPIPEKMTKKIKRIGTIEELSKLFPDMKAFIDVTEQEIPRPNNKRRRKNYYSGKKKKHTVKTEIMVNKKGLILHKKKHKRGKKHDYNIFKETKPPPIPPKVEVGVDLGHQGIEKDYPDLKVNIPVKKKKKQKLTSAEKRKNKKQRKERIIVEHTISKMKKFRIMGQEFRNKLGRYDTMTSIVSGLVNFNIINC